MHAPLGVFRPLFVHIFIANFSKNPKFLEYLDKTVKDIGKKYQVHIFIISQDTGPRANDPSS